MIGAGRNRGVDGRQPVVDALLGQPHHQIEADVVEAGVARFGERRARATGIVQPGEPAKLRVAKRLHADAQTVDTGIPQRRKLAGVNALGVGFERDLRIGGDVERVAAGGDDARDLGRIEQ